MPRRRIVCVFIASLLLPVLSVRADPLQDGIAAVQRKDYPQAVRLLEPLARDGNALAQLRLGLLYYHGHGVRESDAQALQWFERAARQGLADAQFHLGNMYAYGLVTLSGDDDPARLAAQWYFEAARQGHADAQYSLGILFLTGSGVVQDPAEATRWIERAAARGHTDAAAYLKGR
ncbi:MAG: sel1 repeat family protein [Piscinibacter sp.]|nr:sel1 repeat family protein [Piscinibacter sp.]